MSDPDTPYTPTDVDAWHDGLMTPDQRADFERRMQSDATLRAEVDQQTRIDAALKRAFAPPTAPKLNLDRPALKLAQPPSTPDKVPPPAPAQRTSTATRPVLRRPFAIAAALLLAAGVFWAVRQLGSESESVWIGPTQRTVASLYKREVTHGLEPAWVCSDDQEFAATFALRFDQGLTLAALPTGVEALGISYNQVVGTNALHLLARVQGQPVIVLIQRADATPTEPTLANDSGLHLFPHKIGLLTLYEVTPLDTPQLLERFELIDVPQKWIDSMSPAIREEILSRRPAP